MNDEPTHPFGMGDLTDENRRLRARIAELEAEVKRWEDRFDTSQQMVWEQSRRIAELEAEKREAARDALLSEGQLLERIAELEAEVEELRPKHYTWRSDDE